MKIDEAIKEEIINSTTNTVREYLINAMEIKQELEIDIDEVELVKAMVEVEKSIVLGMGLQLLTESIRPPTAPPPPKEAKKRAKTTKVNKRGTVPSDPKEILDIYPETDIVIAKTYINSRQSTGWKRGVSKIVDWVPDYKQFEKIYRKNKSADKNDQQEDRGWII